MMNPCELKKSIEYFETDKIRIQLISSRGLDGFLILSGNVADAITDSDPIYEGKPVMEIMPTIKKGVSPSSEKTAAALNKYLIWCHQTLSAHQINRDRASRNLPPVNALVTQRAGQHAPIDIFP